MFEHSDHDKPAAMPIGVARLNRTPGRRCLSRASRFAVLYVIVLVSVFAGAVFAKDGEGGSAAGGPGDDSGVRLPDIARNYRERFPYAKEAANKDRVTDGGSEKGSTKTYKAYTRVRRKCTDGLGTMDGKKCDVEEGEKYCAEECE